MIERITQYVLKNTLKQSLTLSLLAKHASQRCAVLITDLSCVELTDYKVSHLLSVAYSTD